jgi:tetratricopeptide (TPR) repeat protein
MKKFFIVMFLSIGMPFFLSAQMAKELHATAMECWELADYTCAEIYLQDLIKLEQESEQLADYCLKLGFIKSESGDPKEAHKMLKMALKLNPQLVEAYVRRGVLYSSEGNAKKALADFEKALEIDPDNELALSHRAELMAANMN